MYAISTDKGGLVNSFRSVYGWRLSWKREVRRGVEQDQLSDLRATLGDVHLIDSRDTWSWDLDPSGVFTVRSLRVYIDSVLLPARPTETRWNIYMPIKVNILLWRLQMDR